jgi:hypothetical protein
MRSDQSLPFVAFPASALFVLAVACGLVAAPAARGAVITWGSATNVNADGDVSTTGTLINASNVGFLGTPSSTVNGVTFLPMIFTSPGASSESVTVGNATLTIPANAFNGVSPPNSLGAAPAGVSPSYQKMLSSVVFATSMTLQFSSLVVGAQYQFQWWANEDGLASLDVITQATAGNTVTLHSDPTNAVGVVGQFAIGTFTADASTETISFTPGPGSSGGLAVLSGFQLSQLTTGPTGGGGGGGVPLPPAVWGGMLAGLACCAAASRMKQRAA